MICRACNGTGESRTGRTGEGHCHKCRGGEVPDKCYCCGEEKELTENGICEECESEIGEEVVK